MNAMIRTIKEVHNKDVCMFKIGNFYHVYGRDADIISYLFYYKIKDVDGVKECGFPISSINKIKARLEENKINYLLIDRRNNYEVDDGRVNHVGIVEKVQDKVIQTIEGNSDDMCLQRKYNINSNVIYGYGVPAY